MSLPNSDYPPTIRDPLWLNRQERIDHGELIRWTKGFGALNTEGRDVAAMFRESLKTHVRMESLFHLPPARIDAETHFRMCLPS